MDLTDVEALGAVRSGQFVAEHIEPRADGVELPEEAVQANGVDLSIGELYLSEGFSYIGNDEYQKPERHELTPYDGVYEVLPSNAYTIVYDEMISIPENHIGLVFPRSRLMRCSLQVNTAVWDAGYSGIGEGYLSVESEALLEEDLRVAQMVFIKTEELDEQYDGSHQNERLEE